MELLVSSKIVNHVWNLVQAFEENVPLTVGLNTKLSEHQHRAYEVAMKNLPTKRASHQHTLRKQGGKV
jgi:hypothetical protein